MCGLESGVFKRNGNLNLSVCVFVCVCVSVGLYMQECRYLFRPEEGIRFPGARVTGGYELPNMGLGN